MADMRRKVLSKNSKSDHLTIVNAFQVEQPTWVTLDFFLLTDVSAVWIDSILIYRALIYPRAGRMQSSVEAGMKGNSAGTTSCLPTHSRWVGMIASVLREYILNLDFFLWSQRCAVLLEATCPFHYSDAAKHEGSVCRTSHACRLCQQQGSQRPQI